ncbi:MAG: cytochrome c biogenesis heme-transporting ATPase CcmA [Proteobacteria bacterium]|nr:cytochrome c biogenesis heme-transporting ATPase CcmA [Pseudomonadota bacterium]
MSLEVKNISYMAENKYLFRNLNFNILPGQILMVQGQNGAGKTTLLKVLSGLILPKKGEVNWDKERIKQSMNFHHNLSYVGHQDGLNLELTLLENIQLQLALSQSPLDKHRLQSILSHFSLQNMQNKSCHQLSAGERRKVALSALLLKNKPLWILDEPYTALDQQSITTLNLYFNNHLKNAGMVVMASHVPFSQPTQVINLC